jgi:acetyl esterase/lipase
MLKHIKLLLLTCCFSGFPISHSAFAAPTEVRLAQFNPFEGNPPRPPQAPPSTDRLKARLASLERDLAENKIPADPRNLALLRFKLEQAQLWVEAIAAEEAYFTAPMQTNLAAVLDRAEAVAKARGDAVFPAASQEHERAYISPADDSAQPYWVYVPNNYTTRRKYPVVVFLHGYSPDITKIKPWLPGPAVWKLATDRECIFVVPYGRRNSDFVGIGEDDTLAVTDEVRKIYSVDQTRVFLLGVSMGGYGAHAIGQHSPDSFAGVTTMCGRTYVYLWFKLNREAVAPWKRILYDADDPRHLKLNGQHTPLLMQHGAFDHIVNVENSRLYNNDLKQLGYPVRYNEIQGGDHYIYWQDS